MKNYKIEEIFERITKEAIQNSCPFCHIKKTDDFVSLPTERTYNIKMGRFPFSENVFLCSGFGEGLGYYHPNFCPECGRDLRD